VNRLVARIRALTFPGGSAPLAFLALAVLAFGLVAPRLGYYQDDWPYVFYAFNKGIPSLVEELYWDSRPNAAWLYMALFHLLGFRPLAWHFAALLLRWLTGTVLWFLFRRVWPQHGRQVTFAIVLFLVHPFFIIQPAAVNSMLYWSGFFLYAVSLWLMARSVASAGGRSTVILLAAALEAVHLFTSEYFVGLVLIRPVLLFLLLRPRFATRAKAVRKSLVYWLPYLAVLLAYSAWRIFLFSPPPGGDRNSPRLLLDLITNPVATGSQLARTALQDSLIVTVTSWFKTVGPEMLSFSTLYDWAAAAVMLAAFVGMVTYLARLSESASSDIASGQNSWPVQATALGLLMVVLGLLPLWLIGQDIVTHKNQFAATRFGIGATLGAALFLAAVVEGLLEHSSKKIAVVALCATLAVGMHLRNERLFVFSWEKQVRFYQQLTWRAPTLQPGTAIVSDQEFLPVMGQYAASFGIMTAYQVGSVEVPPYWYFPFYNARLDMGSFVAGTPLEDGRVSMLFRGFSTDSLVVSFDPELDRCLWVLRPEDGNLRLVSDDLRAISSVSALDRIGPGTGAELGLPAGIFGDPSDSGWCYYFEKADLARQLGRWSDATALWVRARGEGQQPGNGFEFLPFIEAFAHEGDWETSATLARAAARITAGLQPSLCETFDAIVARTPASPERDTLILALKDEMRCQDYQ
jgi:hypothetical protein